MQHVVVRNFQPQDLNVLVASPDRVKTQAFRGPLAREQTESGVILIQLIGMIACYPGLLGLIWQAGGFAGARSSKMGVTESKMGVRETHESVTNAHQGARGVSTGRTTRQRVGSAAAGRPVESGPEPPGQASRPWCPWGPLPRAHGWRGLRRRRAPGFYVQAVNFDTSSRSRCRALLLYRAMHLMPFVLRARDWPVRVCTCCRSPPFPRDIGEGDMLMMWGPLFLPSVAVNCPTLQCSAAPSRQILCAAAAEPTIWMRLLVMMMSERETVQPTSFRPSGALSNQLPAPADARRRRACGRVRFRD